MTGGYDAIVLAGGHGARLGGAAKPQLAIGDATLLDRVLAAVQPAGSRIVVGPPQPLPDGVLLVQEEPPGSGPVAGLATGLAQTSADIVVVVAADLPFLTVEVIEAVHVVLDGGEADVALVMDENGRDQYLLGAWRAAPLRGALLELAPLPGRAMRELVRTLRVARVDVAGPGEAPAPWTDIDTPADLERARDQVRVSTDKKS